MYNRKKRNLFSQLLFQLQTVVYPGSFYVVRSKYSLTPPPKKKKLLQKVSQPILVGFSVLFNILKVYQSKTPGKVFKMASKMAAISRTWS